MMKKHFKKCFLEKEFIFMISIVIMIKYLVIQMNVNLLLKLEIMMKINLKVFPRSF